MWSSAHVNTDSQRRPVASVSTHSPFALISVVDSFQATGKTTRRHCRSRGRPCRSTSPQWQGGPIVLFLVDVYVHLYSPRCGWGQDVRDAGERAIHVAHAAGASFGSQPLRGGGGGGGGSRRRGRIEYTIMCAFLFTAGRESTGNSDGCRRTPWLSPLRGVAASQCNNNSW